MRGGAGNARTITESARFACTIGTATYMKLEVPLAVVGPLTSVEAMRGIHADMRLQHPHYMPAVGAVDTSEALCS